MDSHHCVQHQACSFDQITDHIYIGTHEIRQKHFQKLTDLGIRADIDLEDAHIDRPDNIEVFLWLPTPDLHAPTQTQLLVGAEAIRALVEEDKKVYVHCLLGHSRSPTLVAAYFILMGDTPEAAFQRVKERRTIAHLEVSQVEALEAFADNQRDGS